MDSGRLRTEQRLDPVNNMILARLDRLSLELKSTVKSDQIKELVTKEDLKDLTDRMNTHEARIVSIEQEHLKQRSELEALRLQVVELGQNTADREGPDNVYQQRSHIGRAPTMVSNNSPKRMNLVVEGVPKVDDLYDYMILMARKLNTIIYKRDMTLATRLRRRDPKDKRPGPVLVCFVHAHIRDKFLKKKKDLMGIDEYAEVWVKADETLEVRRLKAEFRRIAFKARAQGKEVRFNHEMIQIEGDVYYARDIDSIPDEYKATDFDHDERGHRQGNEVDLAQGKEAQPKEQRPLRERQRRPLLTLRRPSGKVAERPNTSTHDNDQVEGATAMDTNDVNKEGAGRADPDKRPANPRQEKVKNEKIRKTAYGICFSGSTAFPSNLYECEVEDDDIVYRTNEHGYFFNKAKVYKRPDIGKAVLEEKDQYRLRRLFDGLEENEEWNRLSAPTLRRLFRKKMEQHPDLEQRLLETAPLRLIEASMDPRWGGAAPFSSKKYDDGTFTGGNEFGDIATEYRDKKLAELRRSKLTQK